MEMSEEKVDNVAKTSNTGSISNNAFDMIMQLLAQMKKYQGVIKEVESLMKSQKSHAALPVLKKLVAENNGSDIQCRAENVIVVDDNKRSNIVNVLSDIPTISVALKDNGFDIQCGERETNVSILFAGDKNPEVQSLLNVLPICTHNFLFEYISWPFMMTTAVSIFNMTFEMRSTLKAAILTRKVYDPGGCHLIRHLILLIHLYGEWEWYCFLIPIWPSSIGLLLETIWERRVVSDFLCFLIPIWR